MAVILDLYRRGILIAKIISEMQFYVKISGKRHLTQNSVANGSNIMGQYVTVAATLDFL